jgi:hypothetical protein
VSVQHVAETSGLISPASMYRTRFGITGSGHIVLPSSVRSFRYLGTAEAPFPRKEGLHERRLRALMRH